MSFPTQFSHATTRRPAVLIARGLRAVTTGTPDLSVMRAHHAAGIAALRKTGNSGCARLDGGMSCLSLRFTPRP